MEQNITNNPKVTAIFNYIVKVSGIFNYQQRDTFTIKGKENIKLFLLSATDNEAFLLTNDNSKEIQVGDEVVKTQNFFVFTNEKHFGKIINIYGDEVYPKSQRIDYEHGNIYHPFFGLPHNLMSVRTLNEQLYTGIILIDLLFPIGKGQRELIIGDRQTGKTHIAINTIINQAKKNIKCVYVAIGQKKEAITNIYNTLKKYNALDNTIIIDAPSTSPYEQYLAPYVGMAHAENISETNDVLIIFDDLTKHANIFREMALLSDKPVGKEAMPGDMFFAHSSLLERAGSFANKKTITALPILQTIDNDITSLIASNIISITDGQIVTSSDLFAQGKFPAINADLSVSRTGSSVQTRAVTKVSGEIGKIYKAYKRHLKLSLLDYDFNKEISDLLYKGKMIDKLFTKNGFSLYSYSFAIFMTKIISWGILKNIKDDQKALAFLDTLIKISDDAKNAFDLIKNDEPHDEDMMKNYFAYALKQYSDFLDLKWDVNYEYGFIPLDKEILEKIAKENGDK
ncbi:MSC_0619 family F1-like ATPase alpha subunit [Mycoplasma elephantis]|uniref:MSC_0619 family F1-like ATPase alpha subunit n=1 Tax=Mycoplasma elephantis TaxID=114882 RepID=UPI000482AF94|nr:ATP F0F1 synthase subunit alpha [Mycoplasma elephantis]